MLLTPSNGQVHITAANGDVHLEQCSLCPWYKEKPSFGFIVMHGYPIHFLYGKCTIDDHTKGDIIVISCSTTFTSLTYIRNLMTKCITPYAQHKTIANYGIDRLGHLNFSSLVRLSKHDMLHSRKDTNFHFSKDAHTLQLAHNDVCRPMFFYIH